MGNTVTFATHAPNIYVNPTPTYRKVPGGYEVVVWCPVEQINPPPPTRPWAVALIEPPRRAEQFKAAREALERWRHTNDKRLLVTMFHELYAFGPPWTSS